MRQGDARRPVVRTHEPTSLGHPRGIRAGLHRGRCELWVRQSHFSVVELVVVGASDPLLFPDPIRYLTDDLLTWIRCT